MCLIFNSTLGEGYPAIEIILANCILVILAASITYILIFAIWQPESCSLIKRLRKYLLKKTVKINRHSPYLSIEYSGRFRIARNTQLRYDRKVRSALSGISAQVDRNLQHTPIFSIEPKKHEKISGSQVYCLCIPAESFSDHGNISSKWSLNLFTESPIWGKYLIVVFFGRRAWKQDNVCFCAIDCVYQNKVFLNIIYSHNLCIIDN